MVVVRIASRWHPVPTLYVLVCRELCAAEVAELGGTMWVKLIFAWHNHSTPTT